MTRVAHNDRTAATLATSGCDWRSFTAPVSPPRRSLREESWTDAAIVSDRPWRIAETAPSSELAAYPPLIQKLLARRGIADAASANRFLGPADVSWPDALLLPDIEPALERISHALDAGELIAIFGDYDVDGLSATTILAEGLVDLGGGVTTHIPNRYSGGYGLTGAALEQLRRAGASLVIAVDCGITAVEEARYGRAIGLDLIILDHHEPPAQLPDVVAAIDPKRDGSRYPTREPCSGGLALRLLAALYARRQRDFDEARYLDLAALATVCDMVPLVAENRQIVKRGLALLQRCPRLGLRALLDLRRGREVLSERTLGFYLGPRLNAAGRMGDSSLALELLQTREPARAAMLALRLDEINQQRQQLLADALAVARALVPETGDGPVLVLGAPQIARGVAGLVAARLAEEHGRSAFVYEEGEEVCVGSARASSEFDVVAALNEAAPLLLRHGGHRAAGGFSVLRQNLEAFKNRVREAAALQTGASERAPLEIDAEHPLERLDAETQRTLARFAPCGVGNPTPLLLSRRLQVRSGRAVGDGSHLRLQLADGRVVWPAIAFGRAAQAPKPGTLLDVVYSFDTGSGRYAPSLQIADWRRV